MSITIRVGDCRDILRTMPDESVHCVVTSPPYWGLRDYGVDGQLGMEQSLGEHVSTMVDVFREVRRVLRKDGTLWLNYGDSYAASPNGRSAADVKALGNDDRTFRDKPFSTVGPLWRPGQGRADGVVDERAQRNRNGLAGFSFDTRGHLANWDRKLTPNARIMPSGYLKPKDLCGIPWRVAFGLQDDGWWLRQDIIWSKPNPMPESVTDRCTKAHEYLFLMAKSQRYYFDADAISEQAKYSNIEGMDGSGFKDPQTFNGKHSKTKIFGSRSQVEGPDNGKRNKRSVWEIPTSPYSEAHFATFPPALIEPCILAGCPEGGTVLDPFGGAGTTGLVADRLNRNAILIELNPAYAAMAENRIRQDAGIFAEVSTAIR